MKYRVFNRPDDSILIAIRSVKGSPIPTFCTHMYLREMVSNPRTAYPSLGMLAL